MFSKTPAKPILIELYYKTNCPLCVEVKEEIAKAKTVFALEVVEINIEENPEFYEKYKFEIPVIHINGRKAFKYRLEYDRLIKRLEKES